MPEPKGTVMILTVSSVPLCQVMLFNTKGAQLTTKFSTLHTIPKIVAPKFGHLMKCMFLCTRRALHIGAITSSSAIV